MNLQEEPTVENLQQAISELLATEKPVWVRIAEECREKVTSERRSQLERRDAFSELHFSP